MMFGNKKLEERVGDLESYKYVNSRIFDRLDGEIIRLRKDLKETRSSHSALRQGHDELVKALVGMGLLHTGPFGTLPTSTICDMKRTFTELCCVHTNVKVESGERDGGSSPHYIVTCSDCGKTLYEGADRVEALKAASHDA